MDRRLWLGVKHTALHDQILALARHWGAVWVVVDATGHAAELVNLLRQMVPKGVWLHDRQDGNGDSHLKAGLIGPSEVIPVIDGKLGLSQWQNIFLCEFDGPRDERRIVCTVLPLDNRSMSWCTATPSGGRYRHWISPPQST